MRILLLAPCPPWPANTGRTQRTQVLYRALSRLGKTDTFILPPPPDEDRRRLEDEFGMVDAAPETRLAAPRLFSLLRRRPSKTADFLVHLARYHPRMYRPNQGFESQVADLAARNRYDLIVGRYSLLACKATAYCHAPLIVDVDDIDYMIPRTGSEPGKHAATSEKLSPPLCARGIEPIVREFWKHCEHLWLANGADAEHVESGEVSELPNIPFADTPDGVIQPCPPNDASRTILLVAYTRWYPNRDGIERFLHGAWPLVLARHPDARLEIIGKASELDTARWARHRNVHPRGFVDDLRASYAGAAFAVAPHLRRAAAPRSRFSNPSPTAAPASSPRILTADTKRPCRTEKPCCGVIPKPGWPKPAIFCWKTRRSGGELAEFGVDAVGRHYSQQRVDEIVANTVERVLRRRRGSGLGGFLPPRKEEN